MTEIVVGDEQAVDGVVSLSDRKRIRELEQELNLKNEQLAKLQGVIKPVLDRPGFQEERCWHDGGFYVFDKEPRVTCKLCGHDMDPIEVLRKIAHKEIVFCYENTHLKNERKRMVEELEMLRRQRNNLKRSVRRAETGK